MSIKLEFVPNAKEIVKNTILEITAIEQELATIEKRKKELENQIIQKSEELPEQIVSSFPERIINLRTQQIIDVSGPSMQGRKIVGLEWARDYHRHREEFDEHSVLQRLVDNLMSDVRIGIIHSREFDLYSPTDQKILPMVDPHHARIKALLKRNHISVRKRYEFVHTGVSVEVSYDPRQKEGKVIISTTRPTPFNLTEHQATVKNIIDILTKEGWRHEQKDYSATYTQIDIFQSPTNQGSK